MSVYSTEHIVSAHTNAGLSDNLIAERAAAGPAVPLVFAPIPLASGNTLPRPDVSIDADGGGRVVTAMSMLITVEGSDEPVEVALEYRFGGWWAPALAGQR